MHNPPTHPCLCLGNVKMGMVWCTKNKNNKKFKKIYVVNVIRCFHTFFLFFFLFNKLVKWYTKNLCFQSVQENLQVTVPDCPYETILSL